MINLKSVLQILIEDEHNIPRFYFAYKLSRDVFCSKINNREVGNLAITQKWLV